MPIAEKLGVALPENLPKSSDYLLFVDPWKDDPEMLDVIGKAVRIGLTASPDEFDQHIETLVDGESPQVLQLYSDVRFTGNGFHSIRAIVHGVPLDIRQPTGRGVSDKSGKKG